MINPDKNEVKLSFAKNFNRDMVKKIISNPTGVLSYMSHFLVFNVPCLSIDELKDDLHLQFDTFGVKSEKMSAHQRDEIVSQLILFAQLAGELATIGDEYQRNPSKMVGSNVTRFFKDVLGVFIGIKPFQVTNVLGYTHPELICDIFDYFFTRYEDILNRLKAVTTTIKSNPFSGGNDNQETIEMLNLKSTNDFVGALSFYCLDKFEGFIEQHEASVQLDLWNKLQDRELFSYQTNTFLSVLNPIIKLFDGMSGTQTQSVIALKITSLSEELAIKALATDKENQGSALINAQKSWLQRAEDAKFRKIIDAFNANDESTAISLIQSGFNPKKVNNTGWTLMHHWAACEHLLANVFTILCSKAEEQIKVRDNYNGWTPLEVLVERCSDNKKIAWKKAKLLINHNNPLGNLCYLHQQSVLHSAAVSGHYSMVNLLIKSMSESELTYLINLQDSYGRTPLDYAENEENEVIFNLLREYSALTTDEIKAGSESQNSAC